MAKKTSSQVPLGLPVGLLGGGQLARMLCLAADELGLEPWVLSKSPEDPAAQVTRHWIQGDPNRPADLKKILSKVQVLTFESEFFNMENLKKASTAIHPRPALMQLLQDRRTQKDLLKKYKIPTARFCRIDTPNDFAKAKREFPQGGVLKKAQGGYDGYGTFMIKKPGDFDRFQSEFFPAIIEDKIPFKRELAMMFFRNEAGEVYCYPLVESRQRNSKCDLVWGPVQHKKIHDLQKRFVRFLKGTGYVGALGVEFFDAGDKLLVNELAPRVHNSGHYSQNAFTQSQFHLHWKAILNLPLTPPIPTGDAFVMANLIGESKRGMKIPASLKGSLHWYGKSENRPGRKMGHVNYVGAAWPKLLKLAEQERKRIRK